MSSWSWKCAKTSTMARSSASDTLAKNKRLNHLNNNHNRFNLRRLIILDEPHLEVHWHSQMRRNGRIAIKRRTHPIVNSKLQPQQRHHLLVVKNQCKLILRKKQIVGISNTLLTSSARRKSLKIHCLCVKSVALEESTEKLRKIGSTLSQIHRNPLLKKKVRNKSHTRKRTLLDSTWKKASILYLFQWPRQNARLNSS